MDTSYIDFKKTNEQIDELNTKVEMVISRQDGFEERLGLMEQKQSDIEDRHDDLREDIGVLKYQHKRRYKDFIINILGISIVLFFILLIILYNIFS